MNKTLVKGVDELTEVAIGACACTAKDNAD